MLAHISSALIFAKERKIRRERYRVAVPIVIWRKDGVNRGIGRIKGRQRHRTDTRNHDAADIESSPSAHSKPSLSLAHGAPSTIVSLYVKPASFRLRSAQFGTRAYAYASRARAESVLSIWLLCIHYRLYSNNWLPVPDRAAPFVHQLRVTATSSLQMNRGPCDVCLMGLHPDCACAQLCCVCRARSCSFPWTRNPYHTVR